MSKSVLPFGLLALVFLSIAPSAHLRAQQSAEQLTHATLKSMLTNMGYTVGEGKNQDGSPSSTIQLTTHDYKLFTAVTVSPSKKYVWIFVRLFEIPAAQAANFDAAGLLARNDDVGPYFFSLNNSNHTLFLNYALLNSGITPAMLKSALDGAVPVLDNSVNMWDPSRWKGAPPRG